MSLPFERNKLNSTPYLAWGTDLLIDEELVNVGPLVSRHLHHLTAVGIRHDSTVAADEQNIYTQRIGEKRDK